MAEAFNEPVEVEFGDGVEQMPDGSILVDNIEEVGDEILEPGPTLREFDENLVSSFSKDDLEALGEKIIEDYDDDVSARTDWLDIYTKGLETLRPEEKQISEDRPANRSSRKLATVIHPVIAEAATQFQARAIGELFPPQGPVGATIVGDTTETLTKQANRVRNYMNYQLTEEMVEYFPDMDQMLFHLPLVGQTYKKSWFDINLGRVTSRFVQAENFVIEPNAADLETATRYSHFLRIPPHEFQEYVTNNFYENLPEGTTSDGTLTTPQEIDGISQPASKENDLPAELVETHCYLDLESTSLEPDKPFVVTVHYSTHQVVAVRRNWDEEDTDKYKKLVWFTSYKFLPGLGVYGFGLYHIIGGLGKAATGALRALLDSAAFATLQGGFKLRGRVQGGEVEVAPGEFPDIDAAVDDVRKAIMSLPFKEPSPTMMTLLTYVVDTAKRFATTVETSISDANQNTPVGTTMALLEENSRVFSAVHKRLHNSQRHEFKVIAKLNGIYLPDRYPYKVKEEDQVILKDDFDSKIDVIPVSDPATFSSTQRIAQAQASLQLAQSYPQYHNVPKVLKRMYEAMRTPNYDEMLLDPADVPRQDAVAENVAIMTGKPVRALEDQDHMAHMTVLDDWFKRLPDQIKQGVANPYMSHRAEHMALHYRSMIQAQMQAPMPPLANPSEEQPVLPPQLDAQISQAAAVLVTKNPQQPIGPEPPEMPGQSADQDPMKAAQMLAEAEAMSIKVKAQADAEAKQMKAQQDIQIKWANYEMEVKIDNIRETTKAKVELMRERRRTENDQEKLNAEIDQTWAKAEADIQIAKEKAEAQIQTKLIDAEVLADVKRNQSREDVESP